MKAFFVLLDAWPALYWAGAVLATLGVIIRAICKWRNPSAPHAGGRVWPAGGLLFLMLLAWRWPELLIAQGVPAREAQLVASAITVAEQTRAAGAAIYHAGGPLTSLLLLPTHALSVPQDYFNARFVAVLLDGASLLLLLAVLARRWGEGRALLALAPLMVTLAMPGRGGLAAYSTAHVMLFLLCLAGWGAMRSAAQPTSGAPSRGLCAMLVAGISLGLLPWAGLEGCGIAAAFIGVWALGPDWPHDRYRLAIVLGLACYLVLVGLALTHGLNAWDDFVQGYVSGGTGALTGGGPTVMEWAALAVAAAALGTRSLHPSLRWAWAAAMCFATIMAYRSGPPSMLGQLAEHWRHPRGEMAKRIHAMQLPGDTLAILGAAPEIQVETGLASATRSQGGTAAGAAGREFLRDLKRNRPAFFVAASATYPTWEELADFLRENYRAAGADGAGRKLLLRADRMAEQVLREPGVVPVTVTGLLAAEAFAGVGDIGAGRISAHPPSRLVHPVPRDADELRGIFGFLPAAYANPTQATDGARFIINWRGPGDITERALERYLAPARLAGDRDAVEFRLAIPTPQPVEVEFIVEPGTSMSYDWVYWGELRFRRAK